MSLSDDSSATGVGGGEIMLFGVRVKVDPMRKSVSMSNLSEYDPVSNTGNLSRKELPEAAKDGGYASADDAAPQPSGASERKRGTPWTEEEHKRFLIGLEKNGKGDWRGIARNFVKTRTPTQVASHAQKYFLRRHNLNRRRRRSSLFDITTDSVAAMPMEEARKRQEIATQPAAQPTSVPVSMPVASNVNLYSTMPYPMTVGPVLVSMQGANPLENSAMAHNYLVNGSSSMLVHHVPVLPMPPYSAMADLNINEQARLETSLRLSLSTGQNQSAFRNRNGDGFVSVA